jgi:hypothetical protein
MLRLGHHSHMLVSHQTRCLAALIPAHTLGCELSAGELPLVGINSIKLRRQKRIDGFEDSPRRLHAPVSEGLSRTIKPSLDAKCAQRRPDAPHVYFQLSEFLFSTAQVAVAPHQFQGQD